jgi:hypothetical protein
VFLYSLNGKKSWYRVGEFNITHCATLPIRTELFGAIKQKDSNIIPVVNKGLKIEKWEFLPRTCN